MNDANRPLISGSGSGHKPDRIMACPLRFCLGVPQGENLRPLAYVNIMKLEYLIYYQRTCCLI